MSQPNNMTRLEVVNVETLEVVKKVDMTTRDPKLIQAMSDSLLRHMNTFEFFVRATPSAAPVVVDEPKPFAYVKFRAAQNFSPEGDVDANEWYEFCEQEDVGDDKLPAFPVYTAPPAAAPAATPGD